MSTYTTRADAIDAEITPVIDATEFDIDAIAGEVLGDHEAGYALRVDTDGFWAAVERHAL